MCGENGAQTEVYHETLGSPPRVRGKPVKSTINASLDRITPACAGKTLTSTVNAELAKDHPRVCGENFKSCYVLGLTLGSPPRMRGKLNHEYT